MEILMKQYEKEQQVLRQMEEHGWEAWFVGGCVRDALRGKPCDDIDITTNATPQEVTAVFGAENIIETGLAHGTVTVKPQMAEVTTYRTEGKYTDHRHPDQVTFVRSLREDLKRRDFTINAMAMDCRGHLEDPFGGQEDLKNNIIRAVGNPIERFDEDPLGPAGIALRFGAGLYHRRAYCKGAACAAGASALYFSGTDLPGDGKDAGGKGCCKGAAGVLPGVVCGDPGVCSVRGISAKESAS